MSEILILIRAHIPPENYEVLENGAAEVRSHLAKVLGFQGFTVWESSLIEGDCFLIAEYVDEVASERGLEAWAEFMPTLKNRVPFDGPANVMSLNVMRRVGPRLAATGLDAFLSFSLRVSEPGHEGDLIADVDMVFDGLTFMSGFESAVYGANSTLKEEVVMLATWDSKASFDASLPPRMPHYDVTLYRRVA